MEEDRKTYQWIRESIRRANRKYRNSNQERYNQIQKDYYHAHKEDEEYMIKLRKKALDYYYRKKTERTMQAEADISVLQC